MTRDDIIKVLGADWTLFRELLTESLKSDIALLNRTNASILSHGGKMIRPMLTILMARACGQCNSDTLRFAVASEILHNATLLHDDVADRSDRRRGQPTVNSYLGSSAAVLVGDFWLSRSVDLVLESRRRDRVISMFSQTLSHLAEGEMLQLQKSESGDTREDDYFRIIFCKTASLFEVSGLSGAISADASDAMISAAKDYSHLFGMAFQIKDDILDYAGGDALGKPVGLDLIEHKITLPLLCALKGSGREAEIRSLVRKADGSDGGDSVASITSFVAGRGGVGAASSILQQYINQAVAALDAFPPSVEKDCLAELARYNSFREV